MNLKMGIPKFAATSLMEYSSDTNILDSHTSGL